MNEQKTDDDDDTVLSFLLKINTIFEEKLRLADIITVTNFSLKFFTYE